MWIGEVNVKILIKIRSINYTESIIQKNVHPISAYIFLLVIINFPATKEKITNDEDCSAFLVFGNLSEMSLMRPGTYNIPVLEESFRRQQLQSFFYLLYMLFYIYVHYSRFQSIRYKNKSFTMLFLYLLHLYTPFSNYIFCLCWKLQQ